MFKGKWLNSSSLKRAKNFEYWKVRHEINEKCTKLISTAIYIWPILRSKQHKFLTLGCCNLNNCHMVCVENICKYSACSISRSCHKLVWVWVFSSSFSWQRQQSQCLIFTALQPCLSTPPGSGAFTPVSYYSCFSWFIQVFCAWGTQRSYKLLERGIF